MYLRVGYFSALARCTPSKLRNYWPTCFDKMRKGNTNCLEVSRYSLVAFNGTLWNDVLCVRLEVYHLQMAGKHVLGHWSWKSRE